MSPKTLVVNADDLAFSTAINSAIEALYRAGHITNATLMVDGNHVDDALGVIQRNPGLGLGLHLDLCPVVGFYDLPYDQMRETLRTPESLRRVADEVARQITRFKSFGLEFTHMDSHRHFHALPELFNTVVEVAAAHGLKTLRLTKEWILPRTPSVYWDDALFGQAAGLLRHHGIVYPDTFVIGWRGFSAASFHPGLNELMVHVGLNDEQYRREHELLASPAFTDMIEKSNIQLSSYRELVS